MQYEHTQRAPLYLILWAVAGVFLVVAWQSPQPVAQLALLVGSAVLILLAMAFRELNVTDRGDHLLVGFGPLPLFKRRIRYSDIERAVPARSSIFDGWGIHLSPSGGWTWNLWGFECVDVFLHRRRKIRIGTDDAATLATFLSQQIRRETNTG